RSVSALLVEQPSDVVCAESSGMRGIFPAEHSVEDPSVHGVARAGVLCACDDERDAVDDRDHAQRWIGDAAKWSHAAVFVRGPERPAQPVILESTTIMEVPGCHFVFWARSARSQPLTSC